ncbi:hypothetical protein GWI33_019961 [Rhynchophorus ferrugineus]|uniref:DDB1- and CUL4-associated factor 5 n=1 Tax=Rhynchophorus ferrugineus TaxID=354439 RepID=A0A834HX89_RHYFE|nr:hypothetical protein GWI33_019961 [Rhynchophorus ferrugineus]
MAGLSVLNPLRYIVDRQYKGGCVIKSRIFKERLAHARNFFRKDLCSHYGCVNAIEFSAEGELLVSGGDDRRVLLWSLPKAIYGEGAPLSMKKTHNSNIFCVAFDSNNKKIFSGGNDDQVIIHDIYSGNAITTIPHRKPVYGLSVNPQNDEIISTAGEDGRLLLYDIREAPHQEAQVLAKQKTAFHSVMFNPTKPRYLVSANSEEGIALWDCRNPREELIKYDANSGKTSGISACFDSSGTKVLALRRRLPPVLYNLHEEQAICQFYHPQYYNSCTMKTCSFAGDDDEYVLSGSDDFNLYMWKVPKDNAEWGLSHMVLRGHRSIVNQVRYNKHNNLIASSGVEKMVKLWSTIPIGTWTGSLLKEHTDSTRKVFTHQEYAQLVGSSGERISHDYSDQSTTEDIKMMAFFDSLIQREIEGWISSPEAQTTDSDSDQEQDWSKLVQKMFRNGKNSSDEIKRLKGNKIARLISKKRGRLALMAHSKSSSSLKRRGEKRRKRERRNGSCKKLTKKVSGYLETRRMNSEETLRLRYRTRQYLREACEHAGLDVLLDTPSTSTGITNSNSSMYRVLEQDSDEEALQSPIEQEDDEEQSPEVENLVNILPTPLNGTQEHVFNGIEMSGNGQTSNTRSSSNGVGSYRNSRQEFNNGASTSRGTVQNCLKRKMPPGHLKSSGDSLPSTSSANGHWSVPQEPCTTSSSDEDYEFDYRTPTKKLRVGDQSADSGCGTGPSSSKRSRGVYFVKKLAHTPKEFSSDEEVRTEKFRKRVRKTQLNLRRNMCADSDSN